MHIFTYKWPSDGLSAEDVTLLKELIANRTLVLFQNMPADAVTDFPGGTFTASTDATLGCYAYSAEEGVTDRSDWAVYDLHDKPCSQAISIFGKWIINVDIEEDCSSGFVSTLAEFIESQDKVVAVVGNFNSDMILADFSDTKHQEADNTFLKVKTGNTATSQKFEHGIGSHLNIPVEMQLTW